MGRAFLVWVVGLVQDLGTLGLCRVESDSRLVIRCI